MATAAQWANATVPGPDYLTHAAVQRRALIAGMRTDQLYMRLARHSNRQTLRFIRDELTARKANALPSEAGLTVGHVWTEVRCPAYASGMPADCSCLLSAVQRINYRRWQLSPWR